MTKAIISFIGMGISLVSVSGCVNDPYFLVIT